MQELYRKLKIHGISRLLMKKCGCVLKEFSHQQVGLAFNLLVFFKQIMQPNNYKCTAFTIFYDVVQVIFTYTGSYFETGLDMKFF